MKRSNSSINRIRRKIFGFLLLLHYQLIFLLLADTTTASPAATADTFVPPDFNHHHHYGRQRRRLNHRSLQQVVAPVGGNNGWDLEALEGYPVTKNFGGEQSSSSSSSSSSSQHQHPALTLAYRYSGVLSDVKEIMPQILMGDCQTIVVDDSLQTSMEVFPGSSELTYTIQWDRDQIVHSPFYHSTDCSKA